MDDPAAGGIGDAFRRRAQELRIPGATLGVQDGEGIRAARRVDT